MADLYRNFQLDRHFRIFRNGGNIGFREIIEDPDKLRKSVLAHRDFKKKNKIEDIDEFINDIRKFGDKKIIGRLKLLDDFSKDPNEQNYLLLDKFLAKSSLNRFDFKKGMIPPETIEKKMEMEVKADGSLSKEEEKELEETRLKQLKDIQDDIERREKKMKADMEMKDKLVNDMKKIQVEMEKNDGNMMKEKEEKEQLEYEIDKIKRDVESTRFRMGQRKSTDEPKNLDKEEDEEDFLRGERRRSKAVTAKEEEERKKLLEEAEKQLDDVVDRMDRNRQQKEKIGVQLKGLGGGRLKNQKEQDLDKELDELMKEEAQIKKDKEKLSSPKAMGRMEQMETKEDDEDEDEIVVSDLPDDLETPRGEPEPEEEKEEEQPEALLREKEGFHTMPDGKIMSGETHSSSSKPVDPMTISKSDMKGMKEKQEQGIMDIPTGLTPLPEDRRSAEGKSIPQLKSDINYFFKNYGEILKPQIKQYRTLKKTKENLKNFHRRIVGILIPNMKEGAMDGKKIGIILDAEQYLNNKINEILLQKITEGLRPEDLLVDVTKPDDSQKRTGKQYGSYIVKGDRGGKLASERAPVFRAIPSSNEDKMEDPYKYEEKSNDIQMLRSQRWSKVNAAKKKVRIDPFIRYSKPSQIEIRL